MNGNEGYTKVTVVMIGLEPLLCMTIDERSSG